MVTASCNSGSAGCGQRVEIGTCIPGSYYRLCLGCCRIVGDTSVTAAPVRTARRGKAALARQRMCGSRLLDIFIVVWSVVVIRLTGLDCRYAAREGAMLH